MLCVYLCPSLPPSFSPSIHRSLGHPSAYISQGICKKLINEIMSPLKTNTKVSLWKTSRKISSISFSSSCSCRLTLSPPSHRLGSWLFVQFSNRGRAHTCWDVGGQGGDKVSLGLTTFLNSFAHLI